MRATTWSTEDAQRWEAVLHPAQHELTENLKAGLAACSDKIGSIALNVFASRTPVEPAAPLTIKAALRRASPPSLDETG